MSHLITQLRNQGIETFLNDNSTLWPHTSNEIQDHYYYFLRTITEHLHELVMKDNNQSIDFPLFMNVINSFIPCLPALRVSDLDEIPRSINASIGNIESSSLRALAFQIVSLTSNTQAIRNNKEFRADMVLPTTQVKKLIEELRVINLKSVAGAIDRAGASSPKSIIQIGDMIIRFFSLKISDLIEYLSKIYSPQTPIKEGLDEVARLIRNRSCIPEDDEFEEEFMKTKDQLKATSHTQRDYTKIARQLGIHTDYMEKLKGY
jgi:hypothetical protein